MGSRRGRNDRLAKGSARRGSMPMRFAHTDAAAVGARSDAPGGGDATVVIVDAAGTVVSVNPDFERTAGYSRYEILGKRIAELQEGERDRLLFRLIEDAARTRRADSEVFPRRRDDGKVGLEAAT